MLLLKLLIYGSCSLTNFFCYSDFMWWQGKVVHCGWLKSTELMGGNSNKFSPHESAAQMNGVIWAVGDF